MIYFAEGLSQQGEEDLLRLVTLDPGAIFPPETAPETQDRFKKLTEAHPEPLELSAKASRDGNVIDITTSVKRDAAGLTSGVRIHYRTPENLAWITRSNGTISIEEKSSIQYYVELIGPGSTILATSGSKANPISVAPQTIDKNASAKTTRPRHRVFLYAMGGLLAAAAVTTVALIATDNGGTGDTSVTWPTASRP